MGSQQLSQKRTESKSRIESLKESLDFSKLYIEDFDVSKKFIIVPIRETFKSLNNTKKNPVNSAVFTIENNIIVNGVIIQYLNNKERVDKMPSNVVTQLFNHENLQNTWVAGLSIADEINFETEYKEGKFYSHANIRTKPGSVKSNDDESSSRNKCTDWYWVTTYADGSQNWQYLYTTCEDNCEQTKVILDKSFSRCGGGGNGIDVITSLIKIQDWKAFISPDEFNILHIIDELNGTSSSRSGNKFTSIVNKDDGMVNQLGDANLTAATWYKDTNGITTWVSPDYKTGSTHVTGLVRWNNVTDHSPVKIDKSKSWTADVDLY